MAIRGRMEREKGYRMSPWVVVLAVVAGVTAIVFAGVSWYRSPRQQKRRRTRRYLRKNLRHLDIKRSNDTDWTSNL